MSIFSFIFAHKASSIIAGLVTAAVAVASIPVAFSYASKPMEKAVNVEALSDQPNLVKLASDDDTLEPGIEMEVPAQDQADEPNIEAGEDQTNPWVSDEEYGSAGVRMTALLNRSSDYRSRIFGVTKEFANLGKLDDRLARCRAKNYPGQSKVYDFSGLYGAYTSAKEDVDSLDRIIVSVTKGDLWDKQRAVEGNRDLNRFKDFESSLTELEGKYASIEKRASDRDLATKLGAAVSSLRGDLDACDWQDIIRLNNMLGEQYRSAN